MRREPMLTIKGNPAEHQFIEFDSNYTMFVSYNTNIVKTTFENGIRVVYLDAEYYDYSQTTIRYRNQFLGETSKEIEKKIKDGIYLLTNLNN